MFNDRPDVTQRFVCRVSRREPGVETQRLRTLSLFDHRLMCRTIPTSFDWCPFPSSVSWSTLNYRLPRVDRQPNSSHHHTTPIHIAPINYYKRLISCRNLRSGVSQMDRIDDRRPVALTQVVTTLSKYSSLRCHTLPRHPIRICISIVTGKMSWGHITPVRMVGRLT